MSSYEILDTQPTVYNDQVHGVINGVLVRFRITPYNEVHEVRVPEMNVTIVKQAIEKLVTDRDLLAGLGTTE